MFLNLIIINNSPYKFNIVEYKNFNYVENIIPIILKFQVFDP